MRSLFLKQIFTSLTPKLRALRQFFLSQGITIAGNLVYGLLCVRLLPTSEYSKFVVLFAVQGTVSSLMDANLSVSLIPLIGDRVGDRNLVADYVASLRQLTYWLYAAVGLGLVVAYPLLVRHRHWGWPLVAAMVVTLLVSTWFVRIGSTYGTVLILLRERTTWYRGQIIYSLGTLALLLAAWGLHLLSAYTAILFNILGILFLAAFYFLRARSALGVRGIASKTKKKSIVHLALPNVPQAVFYALQGQIALFLITYFGRTAGVGSVGALARLGAIFTLVGQMNPVLIEPYFAKISKQRLKGAYIAGVSLAIAGCVGATLLAGFAPQVFLWVLGPQYSSLHYELVLAIGASSVSALSAFLWCVHSARRFVFWWSNNLSMVLIVVVQAAFIAKFDMSLVRSVLMLNLATNAASLLVNVGSGVYGFIKGPREVEAKTEVDTLLEMENVEYVKAQTEAPGP